jgi:hypothetical protein
VEAAEAGQLEGARRWRRKLVASSGSGEVLRLGGGIRPLGPSQKWKRNAGAELAEEGNSGDALA